MGPLPAEKHELPLNQSLAGSGELSSPSSSASPSFLDSASPASSSFSSTSPATGRTPASRLTWISIVMTTLLLSFVAILLLAHLLCFHIFLSESINIIISAQLSPSSCFPSPPLPQPPAALTALIFPQTMWVYRHTSSLFREEKPKRLRPDRRDPLPAPETLSFISWPPTSSFAAPIGGGGRRGGRRPK